MDSLLRAQNLCAGYGLLQILQQVTVHVERGEIVVLLGANGAGKTTLLRTLVGLHSVEEGIISWGSMDITRMRTDRRIAQGMAYLSEIGVITSLSIEDNLRMGAYTVAKGSKLRVRMEEMYAEFPDLSKRRREPAGSLSGGQRKMLAVARALMSNPKVVLMDEPSAGLSPLFVSEVIDIVRKFANQDTSFLIAEQNTKFLELANRVYVMDGGRILFDGSVEELEENDAISEAYFGIRQ
ncbi:MAG: ABC transporter ATP-binding protein [Alicyclobacillaceae bacterium]|jgi:branched-chain amino acid transport system ATP-binding protein|nr:ABC transporter ATP-binding protein [Alicyclobacillaceae bacterium]